MSLLWIFSNRYPPGELDALSITFSESVIGTLLKFPASKFTFCREMLHPVPTTRPFFSKTNGIVNDSDWNIQIERVSDK